MIVEIGSHHLAVLGPVVEGVDSGMCADEALAVITHKREQVGLLLWGEFLFAQPEEEDCVEVVEVFCIGAACSYGRSGVSSSAVDIGFGEELCVSPYKGYELAALATESLDGGECVRDRVVLVASVYIANGEHLLLSRKGILRRGGLSLRSDRWLRSRGSKACDCQAGECCEERPARRAIATIFAHSFPQL